MPLSSNTRVVGTTPTTTSSTLFLEPLANEGDWDAYLDEDSTGLVYYFNQKTGESLWEPPTSTFPSIRLAKTQRKVARKKQREYKEKNKQEGGGFLSGVLSAVAEKEKTTTTSVSAKQDRPETVDKKVKAEESPNWFNGIFDTPKEEPIKVEKKVMVEKKMEPKKKESTTGFSLDLFGSKEETPVNGKGAVSSAVVEEEKKTPAKKDTTTTSDDTTQDEAQKPRFGGLKSRVANVFKREPGQATTREPLEIDVASYVLPHPAKVSWGGEDAVFVKGRTFGVFDGVSGADKLDGVPLYSKTLAEEAQNLVGDKGLNTKEISSIMLEAAEFADKTATGASTALVASITDDGYLRAVNLGDSVCLLVRDNVVRSKTREIVHYWECPYQLAEGSPDRPKDSTKLNVEVLPGDTILMGSDGIFDNLNEETICDTIASTGPNDNASAIAKRIVELSRKISLDTEADTPYAPLAKKNGEPDYKSGKGGKLDDVSCVVVRCS